MSDKRQQGFDSLMERLSTHLSQEQANQIRSVFAAAPDAMNQLGEEVLAKSAYTREAQQLAAQRQQLLQEQQSLADLAAKVTAYDEYLRTNHVTAEQFAQLKAERDNYQSQFEQLKQTYPELADTLPATQFGAPTSTTQPQHQGAVMNNNPNSNSNPNANQSPLATLGVTSAQWQADKQNLAAMALLAPATQLDIAARHQTLFGTPIPNMTALVQESAASGKPLEEVWQQSYNVPAKLAELEAAKLSAEVDRRVQDELAKRLGGAVINGTPTQQHSGSPFLTGFTAPYSPEAPQANAPDMARIANQGTGHGTAAQRATEAVLSGKYKGERFELL